MLSFFSSECVTDLDDQSVMSTFKSLFEAAEAVSKIGSSLKPKLHIVRISSLLSVFVSLVFL